MCRSRSPSLSLPPLCVCALLVARTSLSFFSWLNSRFVAWARGPALLACFPIRLSSSLRVLGEGELCSASGGTAAHTLFPIVTFLYIYIYMSVCVCGGSLLLSTCVQKVSVRVRGCEGGVALPMPVVDGANLASSPLARLLSAFTLSSACSHALFMVVVSVVVSVDCSAPRVVLHALARQSEAHRCSCLVFSLARCAPSPPPSPPSSYSSSSSVCVCVLLRVRLNVCPSRSLLFSSATSLRRTRPHPECPTPPSAFTLYFLSLFPATVFIVMSLFPCVRAHCAAVVVCLPPPSPQLLLRTRQQPFSLSLSLFRSSLTFTRSWYRAKGDCADTVACSCIGTHIHPPTALVLILSRFSSACL